MQNSRECKTIENSLYASVKSLESKHGDWAKCFPLKSTSDFRTLSHAKIVRVQKQPPCPTAKASLLLALTQPNPREGDIRASWSASFYLEAALALPGT